MCIRYDRSYVALLHILLDEKMESHKADKYSQYLHLIIGNRQFHEFMYNLLLNNLYIYFCTINAGTKRVNLT